MNRSDPAVNTGTAARRHFDLQGHRGARGLMPENSIPAFLRALELDVTTLEMDVVISRDGLVVVSHEPWFSGDLCTQPSGDPVPRDEQRYHRIYEMTYEQVAQYDCGSRGHPRFLRQKRMKVSKPLLKDVIAAAETYVREHDRSDVQYNIETKSTPAGDGVLHPPPEEFTKRLYDVLAETGIKDRATIQSFDVRTLQAARKLDPDLRLSLLIEAEADRGLEANLKPLGFVPDVYSPEYTLVTGEMVREAHGRGMQVIPWTVNTKEAMRRLLDLGADGIITDYPDIGRTLLP